MGKKVFVIDVTRCVACFNCFIACKDEFAGQTRLPYAEAQPDTGPAWISVNEVERGQFPKVKVCYIPQPCMQCENPTCAKVAKDSAIYQREDGVAIIDPQKSKGQREIVKACPYGCISWNEELDMPQKCTSCVHLLDEGWKEPRCVEVCPTQALRFGEKAQFADEITQAEQLHPEYRTNPSVYYIGLPKTFLAGTLYCSKSGDCLEGAKVSIIKESGEPAISTITNNYGDFEFEGLERDSMYSLKFEAEGYYPVALEGIYTDESTCLEDIYLHKRIQ